MYDDVLKEKESLVIKVAQGEEERKQLLNNNDSLERKMNEHTQVCCSKATSNSIQWFLRGCTTLCNVLAV